MEGRLQVAVVSQTFRPWDLFQTFRPWKWCGLLNLQTFRPWSLFQTFRPWKELRVELVEAAAPL